MSALIPDCNYIITKRYTTCGYLGTDVSVTEWNVRGCLLHIEGATHVATIEGSLVVTGSADAHITSNGVTLTYDREFPAGTAIATFKTPTALGTDKVTNGDMAASGSWTVPASWAIAGGVATHTTGTAADLEQDVSSVASELYLVTFTIKTVTTAGTLTPEVGGVEGTAITASATTSTPVTYNQEILAAGTGNFKLKADATWAGTVDDVIVKKITPINVSLIAWR
jgi:hypothetical protein